MTTDDPDVPVHTLPDVATALFNVWRSPDSTSVQQLLRSIPVPGDLALRSRYDALLDLHRSPTSTSTVTRERWDEQIALMRTGDAAVQRNDQETGTRAFKALRDAHQEGEHPLPLIEAATGLGDLARQRDDIETSLRHYSDAMTLVRKHGCDFARVRVGLGLGYAQLNQASAGAALASFETAVELARDRDWRLDLANALLGAGECHNRLRDPTRSMRTLLEALTYFEDLNSREGIANTTMQLGEVCRRLQWTDDAYGWYSTTVDAIDAHELPVTLANALDGLAEIEVEMGHYQSARRHLGAAARVSLPSYPRGYAHAMNGLARCSYAEGHHLSALRKFSAARDAYVALEVFTAAAASCTGIAACAEHLEEPRLAIEARLDAVRMVEQSRAAQVSHADQAEYFDRFGDYYFTALRAALTFGSIDGFVGVFEAIAGRRLAGLLNPSEGADNAALLAQLARLNAEARHQPIVEEDRARRLARALGRVALSATLPSMARAAIDDVMAEAYQPFTLDGAIELYQSAVTGRPVTVLLAEDERRGQIVWLARFSNSDTPHGGVFAIPEATGALLSTLRNNGLDPRATTRDIDALRYLLPAELVEQLAALAGADEPPLLTLIPAGRLWHVPWTCVLVADSETFLGELVPITISPTLAFAGRNTAPTQSPAEPTHHAAEAVGAADSSDPAFDAKPPADATSTDPRRRISWWKSTQVINHTTKALELTTPSPDRTVRHLDSATDARRALLQSEDDLLVLLAHGRPTPGTVHYIDLDDAIPVTPADLLDATPPAHLVLISCWGAASPQTRHGDPLSVVAVALAKGTRSAAATNSELLDDPLASAFVNLFLNAALEQPLPQALHASTKRFLARADARQGYLSRWAPLIVVGH